jgi:hypothetical protein
MIKPQELTYQAKSEDDLTKRARRVIQTSQQSRFERQMANKLSVEALYFLQEVAFCLVQQL